VGYGLPRRAHRFGDLVVGEVVEHPQLEDLAAAQWQRGDGTLEGGAQVFDVDAGGGRRASAVQVREYERGALACVVPPVLRDRRVAGEAEEARAGGAVGPPRRAPLPDPAEDVLRDVRRGVRRAGASQRVPVDLRPVALEQLVQRGRVVRADAQQQYAIARTLGRERFHAIASRAATDEPRATPGERRVRLGRPAHKFLRMERRSGLADPPNVTPAGRISMILPDGTDRQA